MEYHLTVTLTLHPGEARNIEEARETALTQLSEWLGPVSSWSGKNYIRVELTETASGERPRSIDLLKEKP